MLQQHFPKEAPKIVNYPRWKRELLIVIKINDQGQRRIFCSTDLSLSVEAVLDLYEGRFPIKITS